MRQKRGHRHRQGRRIGRLKRRPFPSRAARESCCVKQTRNVKDCIANATEALDRSDMWAGRASVAVEAVVHSNVSGESLL